jgi:hypothetical protein
MIIEKKPVLNNGDTISFRLTSGDEIIAKLISSDETSITISKPIVVQMQMVNPQQAGLAFAPFMATVDDGTTKFRFERSRLICDPVTPRQDIAAKYIQMTTGLEVPTGGLLKV